MSNEDRSTTAAATAYPLLDAAAGRTPEHRPVWFMRQAGRSLPEYRKVREGIGMLQSCFRPDLVCEITLQPVRRHRTDAAILFSDIVVPLKAAGIDLDIVSGIGPVIEQPVRDAAAVAAMPKLDAAQVEPIAEAVRLLRGELPAGVALIGFSGAPFTLASYLVEGGPSRNHERTKSLMYTEPDTWHALLDALADIAITFLRVQADAGAQAFQLFDSWAGALSLADYRQYVQPHSARVFAALRESAPALPAFHFGVGTGELLGAMGEAGADVVGVDWRVPLDVAAGRVGPGKALQGNLDPATLMADRDTVDAQVRRVVADGDAALAAGATGHVFNLGHGVLPSTDPDALTRVVDLVHAL
ncbi:uroporphyrinogen decarboxylase [Tsukamurella tyrosinosolvens]|uniref:Uroporphyrinogen decarboxylase n=1 Tax=Tsukamurella tyrosinosolvens TaxID=57704 RepID=A0A1H4SHC2_TSUTY|nr:uroporphyrinogen decarboxylase [Tsukamurella tyrosinosolvens]KXO93464.1 uroporphyrinogen decarboxylase [Tsukamurella tyrosinosolvens]KXP05767.1 uroporphyrinogen decarboxylase [Tsukamurella tyrosinosolvens]KZL95586.1 uroporphyrinogen decarboxylase [Tsukamurella tyrosinosolvens]MCA4993627.1 uroporphyrinogen decarboxylase [Tsukamurella tyrosinosolvens]MEC4614050.1 uroporphyrinogen decarboxylase [Tsukamurella tyrosinosolvens]